MAYRTLLEQVLAAMDLYVRHLPIGEYRVIDRVPGNTIEVPATLEELLAVALAAHL